MDLSVAYAMSAPPEGGGSSIMGFIPLVLVMVIFYLLILRPQQRRQKDHQSMVKALGRGDRVLTNGGLYATILDVKDEFFVCTIAEGVKVEIALSAVSAVVKPKKK
ncbi:preprotein translocase subunit YajC [bacterium]|nr:MAG: preprotein translocase subunit YajC [bacterium]